MSSDGGDSSVSSVAGSIHYKTLGMGLLVGATAYYVVSRRSESDSGGGGGTFSIPSLKSIPSLPSIPSIPTIPTIPPIVMR
jgi:hypothetical protein